MKLMESAIQQQIVMYYRNYVKKGIIFSVPNDGKSAREQVHKKNTGMLSGVSDLILVESDRLFFIEVKIPEGKQSENQIVFQRLVENMGYKYFVVRSLEDFKTIVSYLE